MVVVSYDTSLDQLLEGVLSKYKRGELERKDTFSKRVLTTEPKFVQKKRQKKVKEEENQGMASSSAVVSDSENEKVEKMSQMSTSENAES